MKKLISILLLLLAFTPALQANTMVDGNALLAKHPGARNDRPPQPWTDHAAHHANTHCKHGSKCHAHAHKGHKHSHKKGAAHKHTKSVVHKQARHK